MEASEREKLKSKDDTKEEEEKEEEKEEKSEEEKKKDEEKKEKLAKQGCSNPGRNNIWKVCLVLLWGYIPGHTYFRKFTKCFDFQKSTEWT